MIDRGEVLGKDMGRAGRQSSKRIRNDKSARVHLTSGLATIQELSGRLHFLSVGRYAVKVRPLLVDNIRFRLVNKPGCQHEKIGACVLLTTIIGV